MMLAAFVALPLYLSPILENEAHGSVLQYPYLLNRAAPQRFVKRPDWPLFTQYIKIPLELHSLGG